MNRSRTLLTGLATILALSACSDPAPTAVDDDAQGQPVAKVFTNEQVAARGGYAGYPLRVMTRNIYLGASITPLLTAPSLDVVPGLVSEMWDFVRATDFPARAVLIAHEIEMQRPHVVALQEAALYRRQFPGDYLQGNPVPATEVVYDNLQILLDELTTRGLDYEAAVVRVGSDVELPSALGEDIRLTDRQVLLVRGDITVQAVDQGTYQVNVTLPVGGDGGPEVTLSRGWVSVDASIAGRELRFVCTHLERASVAPVQVAQGMELAGLVAASPRPVILMGDHNTRADGSGTETYANLVAGGLVDAWPASIPEPDGYTCCHDDDLLNPTVDFNRRIDLIFTRQADAEVVASASRAVVVGADPDNRSPVGLWPSDHAGVALTLGIRPTRAWLDARPRCDTGDMVVAEVR